MPKPIGDPPPNTAWLTPSTSVHPDAVNTSLICSAKGQPSLSPKTHVTLTGPLGPELNTAINRVRCSGDNLRGSTRRWSSNNERSAFAARSCCFPSSSSTFCCDSFAFAASASRAWARSFVLAEIVFASAASCSAVAARSCCFPSCVLASVNCWSNSCNLLACLAFIRVPVNSAPAPKMNVKKENYPTYFKKCLPSL